MGVRQVVHKNSEAYQVHVQQETQNDYYNEESRKLMDKTLSKNKGVKVKDGKKEGKNEASYQLSFNIFSPNFHHIFTKVTKHHLHHNFSTVSLHYHYITFHMC